jgi:transcriptional regulator with XRE-family HTH domain
MSRGSAKPDNHESRRILAGNVRRRRHALKLTVKAVSERAPIHWRHWQKIEYGKVNVTLETLVRVAGALEVELHVLLLPGEQALTAKQRAARLVDEFFATPGLRDKLIDLVEKIVKA